MGSSGERVEQLETAKAKEELHEKTGQEHLLLEAKAHLELARRAKVDGIGGLDNSKHFWFAIVEKAFAKYNGGYVALDYGDSLRAFEAIINVSGDKRKLSIDDCDLEAMIGYLNEGRWITVENDHCWAVFSATKPDEKFPDGSIDIWEPSNLSNYPKGAAGGLWDYRVGLCCNQNGTPRNKHFNKASCLKAQNRTENPDTCKWVDGPSGMFRLPWNRFVKLNRDTERYNNTRTIYMSGPNLPSPWEYKTGDDGKRLRPPVYVNTDTEEETDVKPGNATRRRRLSSLTRLCKESERASTLGR